MIRLLFVLSFLFFSLSSCAPKPPYEMRSPCVSTETQDSWERTPCVRRPLNGRDLA
jgi:hypothetical protein